MRTRNLFSTFSMLSALALTGVALSACAPGSEQEAGANASGMTIVSTTTPLGSITGQIAHCAEGNSITLLPVGADPHDFSASSSQVADMVKADLIIANGLGLEGGLASSLEQIAADGTPVVEVAGAVDPLPFDGHDHDEHEQEHDHGHDHSEGDPHFWLDAARMALAAELIGQEAADVSGDNIWAECGAQMKTELIELDAQLRETLAAVPEERRAIVADHHSFGYFTHAYDFESAGVIIPGGSTEAEASSQELAALAHSIEEQDVPAIFANTASNQGLVDALASEVGEHVEVVPLFVGSTGEEGSAAEDYQGMMRENARLIVDALT